MDTPTQQAAPAAPGGESAPAGAFETPEAQADAFQSLWDRGAFNPTDPSGGELSPEQRAASERDAQGGTQPREEGAEREQAPKEGEQGAAAAEPEGKDYESLDAYLEDQKLDKDAFLTLPVTVKVDGLERAVPLAELRDAFQLKEASYNRMNALASERTAFQGEQTQVRQALGTRIQQTEALFKMAQDLLQADVNSISPQDWAQMDAGQQALVRQQIAERQQQIQRGLQQVNAARQQEVEQANQSRLQTVPQEREKLLAARPEWKDPAKFEAAREGIVKAGRHIGFTDAELQSITDHRVLLGLDLVSQVLQRQAAQPAALKRVRATPRMAAAGTRQPSNPQGERYRSATQAYARSGGRDDAAGAAMFEEFS